MDTSREDVGILIRSAFLKRDTKQRFSLFVLVILAITLVFIETIDTKPLNYFRSLVKDSIYRGSEIISYPAKSLDDSLKFFKEHFTLYKNYKLVKQENENLKNKIFETDYLVMENNQLRRLIDDQVASYSNLVSSRVMLDKQSPYLNSFIINSGANKEIKKGLAVLDGKNFIGRIVDVNFFSSRVLLVTDLNSKIPVVIEKSGHHAILSGQGSKNPTLEFLPENHKVQENDKVYTSGKGGIFTSGIPIGKVVFKDRQARVNLYSDISQITYVNIKLEDVIQKK